MARPNEAPLPDPLAYLLTWTTYGTWLPGDDRGWVKLDGGFREADESIRTHSEAMLVEPPCLLDRDQRIVVEQTIVDHCLIRNWALHAVNCRTNHVHAVVTAPIHPDRVRDQFKSWCTRRLKAAQQDIIQPEYVRTQWWSERGSSRCLNDETALEAAIVYVRDAQDRPR